MGRIFGTDGIRGRANEAPLTPEFVQRIGVAAGAEFTRGDHRHHVVIRQGHATVGLHDGNSPDERLPVHRHERVPCRADPDCRHPPCWFAPCGVTWGS